MVDRKKQREIDIRKAAQRREALQRKAVAKNSVLYRLLPHMLWTRRTALATTAFSIVIGICAYYYKAQFISVTSGFSWNSASYMTILFHRFSHITGRSLNAVCYWMHTGNFAIFVLGLWFIYASNNNLIIAPNLCRILGPLNRP